MASRNDRLIKLYQFLTVQEESQEEFTLEEAAQASGYTVSTVRTHYHKKLRGHLVFEGEGSGSYQVRGVLGRSQSQFVALMSQKSRHVASSPQEAFVRSLRSRSLESFTLALESYNRPSLGNKLDVFVLLVLDAWAQLLRAQLVEEHDVQVIQAPLQPMVPLGLEQLLEHAFDVHDPVRRNLERLLQLRRGSAYLLTPAAQPYLSRLFQATVLNYHGRYVEAVGAQQIAGFSGGMLSMLIDQRAEELETIAETLGEESAEALEHFLQEIAREEQRLASRSFIIPSEYRLVLTSRLSEDDDMELVRGLAHAPVQLVTPRLPDETHPYRPSTVVEAINEALPAGARQLSMYDVSAIDHQHGVRDTEESELYLLQRDPITHRYAQAYVDWVVEQMVADAQWLERARESYQGWRSGKQSA